MAYPRARKHYRVAQKEVDNNSQVFAIRKKHKNKALTLGILFTMVLFLNGFILGMLLGRSAR